MEVFKGNVDGKEIVAVLYTFNGKEKHYIFENKCTCERKETQESELYKNHGACGWCVYIS